MLFETLLTILVLVSTTECSRVVDGASQAGIYVSDYCPKTPHCPEGTHVMCMYYNPNRIMGPRCRNARNISVTPELANKLLDVSNAVRSKIARGDERGKDGQKLPRGYGIFRLKWDSELATFAQVLVNQCVLRHDQCRATKRFPSPGQTAGLVRFSVPDWIPKQDFGNFTEPGFTNAKLLYATAQILKSWYRQKSEVTPQILANYPDWTLQPNNLIGKLYMEMIYGPATHMGCGVAAYTEYAFYDNNTPLYYNSIQIVCNFSARPLAGGAVFNTVPPGDTTILNPCGCPAGSVEDEDCLCHEELKEPVQQLSLTEERACSHGMQCDPTVVLLPIFTVEDAPAEKLVADERHPNTTNLQDHIDRMDITDSLQILDNNFSELKHTFRAKIKIPEDPPNTRANVKSQWHSYPKQSRKTVKNRHFGSKQNELIHDEEIHNHRVTDKDLRKDLNSQIQRSSIFSKAPRFELPGAHVFSSTSNKRNVLPRKDFSENKHLIDKYLYTKESIVKPIKRNKPINSFKTKSDSNEPKSLEISRHNYEPSTHIISKKLSDYKNVMEHTKDLHFGDIMPVGYGLDSVEERLINDNENLENELNNTTHFFSTFHKPAVNSVTEVSDNKLMALLDTLEQEVKHIKLRDDEKKLFDAKIKKIYGKVVGKPVDAGLEFRDIVNQRRFSGKQYVDIENKHLPLDDTIDVEHIQHLDVDVGVNFKNKIYGDEMLSEKFNDSERRQETSLNLENHLGKEQEDEIVNYLPKFRRSEKNNLNREATVTKILSNVHKTHIGNQSYRRQNRNNIIRPRNLNEINSYERLQDRHRKYIISKLPGYSEKNAQRRELLERQAVRKNNEKFKRRNNNIDRTNTDSHNLVAKEFTKDDPLSIDRRKYYQEKLDSIQRNLQNVRRLNHKKENSNSRHLRAMLPSAQRSVNQIDSLDAPGRARFLHGY